MISIIVGLVLSWYFFNFIENNSYVKNVTIYAVANFGVCILNELFAKSGFHIITNIIGSIIGGLLIIKVMEFVKARTNSLVAFVLLSELCIWVIAFCIALCVSWIL